MSDIATDSNPTTEADLEAHLLALGHKTDSGDELSDAELSAARPAPARPAADVVKEQTKPETQPGDDPNKAKAPQPGEKPDAEKPVAEAKKDDEPKTPAERAAKEAERRDRSWQALEAEKAAVRAEKEALERQKAEAVKPEVKASPATELRDERGFTAKQYDQAAKDFEAEGDKALADEARKAAEVLRTKETETTQQRQHEEHRDAWMKVANETVAAEAALQDLNTPLAKEVKGLLTAEPVFQMLPDGFKKAVEIARTRLAAAEVPSLKAEIDKLSNDLREAQGKLAIGDGSVQRPAKNTALSDRPLDEQEREIRRMASDFDAEHAA